uniref:ATP synthase subunit 8 n=1 Tax=Habropoda radoszkowskii TaxID=597470 RepID=A0A7L8EZR4_9HYME|nr:ATP synthase F0 subunit 8 [Habropoda radoszkowskii]QOE17524.1 ATP synthase subunit 8 [Habropoda radoszkowskii]
MPQMGPMNWLFLSFVCLLNLFLVIIYINSVLLKTNKVSFSLLMSNKMKLWSWLW